VESQGSSGYCSKRRIIIGTMTMCHVFGDCSKGIEKANQKTWALLSAAVLRPVWSIRCHAGAHRASASVLTAHALEQCPGWQHVDPFDLSVKHNHGYGGSETFRVSAPRQTGALPLEVAVHVVPTHKTFTMERIEAASALFAANGLAPQRLAQGDSWYIEPWEGCGHPSLNNAEFFRDLGALLAKIHALPTPWFDVHRTQLCNQTSALQEVPLGSHAWCFCGHSQLDELEADVLNAFLDPALVVPAHPVASRIVTSHGDLHPQNMLNAGGRAMCIDFEYACVTYAVFDLALGVALAGFSGDMNNRQVLMHSYLETIGDYFGPEDVEALVFEAEMARACYLHGVLQPSRLTYSPHTALGVISAMKCFVSRARASQSLRMEIMRLGFRRCADQDVSLGTAWLAHSHAQAKRMEEIVEGGCTRHSGNNEEVSSSPDDSWSWLGLPLGLPIFPEANCSRL